jgi:phosphatidylinositol-3-phosphatase
MRCLLGMLLLLLPLRVPAGNLPAIQTVFVILMENENWSSIHGSPDAPYINQVLLPTGSHCEQYYNPPGLHPSEPNYLWLEAGTNFGIRDNNDPSVNHQNTTNHLVALLRNAGISWKTYQEDVSGTYIPLTATNAYAPRHNPFVYFDDVTGTNNPNWTYGIAHIRPYSELAADLTNHTVARYNFITPNLCNDMHDSCPPLYNPIRQCDFWLAAQVPRILSSAAYQNGGALFILWDEADIGDGPIGMIVLSPLARGGGYCNYVYYTHSSTLRTVQEIFGVTPLLGDAANAANLSDLFYRYEFSSVERLPGGAIQLVAVGVIPGRTNLVQASTNLANWVSISTNIVSASTFTVTDTGATNLNRRFYRLVQVP